MEHGKKCLLCKQVFIPSKFHPHQKYCKECSIKAKKTKIKQWWVKNGKEYIKKYMKHYRTLLLVFALYSIAYADEWQDVKKGTMFENLSGTINIGGSFIRPPKYQLSIKMSDNSFLTLQRFSIKKRGWTPTMREEELELEQKVAGGWSIEYGGQSVMSETSLLEQDSIYGWKATFGQTAEFAWGQGSYGDRVALAGFNTEKYSLLFVKSYGKKEDEEFLYPDTPLPKVSSSPVTKYQGGDIRIPYQFRQTSGEIEVAWKQRFDEEEQKYVQGYGFTISANMPKASVSLRNISKDFESKIRTTDIQIKAILLKKENYEIYSGAGIIDFSGEVDTRYSAIAGASLRKFGITFSPETQLFKKGKDTGISYSGTISGTIFQTNISARRGENITGYTTSRYNHISISKKEGSISLNYSTSESNFASAVNMDTNISLNLPYNMRISIGGGISRQETPTTITEYRRGNISIAVKNTNLSAILSPQAETYTVSKTLPLSRIKAGESLSVGISYQRFIGGDGVTGSITYSW